MSFRSQHRDRTDSKKTRSPFKGGLLPSKGLRWTRAARLQSFYQKLNQLGLEKLGVLTAFFDGTLADYVGTEKGKAELDGIYGMYRIGIEFRPSC